jgi:hypothetical protein
VAELDPRWMEELTELLRIPSISADPERAEDVRRAAEWVADAVRRMGGDAELVETFADKWRTAELLRTNGLPSADTVLADDATAVNALVARRSFPLVLKPRHGAGSKGVAVVAVNVNTVAEDRLEAMKERAEQQGFNFAYIYDPSQQIARDYAATVTPHVFLLDGERKVVQPADYAAHEFTLLVEQFDADRFGPIHKHRDGVVFTQRLDGVLRFGVEVKRLAAGD